MIGPVLLAALVLVQAQAPGKAETLATLYGRTLGAAADCPGISRERLEAAATQVSAHLKAMAQGDEAAQAAAGTELARSIDRGNRDVRSGVLTCAQAESEFGNLEHDLAASR